MKAENELFFIFLILPKNENKFLLNPLKSLLNIGYEQEEIRDDITRRESNGREVRKGVRTILSEIDRDPLLPMKAQCSFLEVEMKASQEDVEMISSLIVVLQLLSPQINKSMDKYDESKESEDEKDEELKI
ncbi:hypothetical protein IEQ34_021853 [Dendrobium chrysotoxum]|uniref:Uncharacterized protein n=1 Tax=Dendrobium chrysotoxum TaxID=161865 RepID=A0AAV7FXD8_DENCH|nr:hypothetical protein IEQ34_021853 [Dendrobium chrysotoxum]